MICIYDIKLFWLDLSRPEIVSHEKVILEYRFSFFEVSILPNFVWGNYPLGFESFVLFVSCESHVREVTSTYSGLYVEIDRFRLLGFFHVFI